VAEVCEDCVMNVDFNDILKYVIHRGKGWNVMDLHGKVLVVWGL